MSSGYVYILSNPSMPGLVKIGMGLVIHTAMCQDEGGGERWSAQPARAARESRHMSENIPPSGHRGKHWSVETDWRRLSDAVAALKRKVETAYYHGDEAEADAAHDDLVSAEWRLRQAERRRDRG